MAGPLDIDYPAVVRLGRRNWRHVLPRQNTPAKAGNYDGQEKALLAGRAWINTRPIFTQFLHYAEARRNERFTNYRCTRFFQREAGIGFCRQA